MILIVGATGTTGRDTVAKLIERGAKVRAMTRDPERTRALPGFGEVEVVAGDPEKPESLGAAFSGVEKVFIILPGGPNMAAAEKNTIAAARDAGVKHIVKLSATCADPNAPSLALSGHYQGEQLLKESGIPFTVLRASAFMQNFANYYAPTIRAEGVIYHCVGDAKMAMVDTRDIAELAAHVLLSVGHEGKTYDVTGPEALTYADVAEKLSAVTGRTITYRDVPPDVYEQVLTGMGVPAFYAAEVVNIYGRGPWRAGQTAAVASTIEDLLGRKPRSFSDFARDHAAHFNP